MKIKEKYLKHFAIENKDFIDTLSGEEKEFAEEVVTLAKQKGLSYIGAYAGLEYAYKQMKYESNFLPMQ